MWWRRESSFMNSFKQHLISTDYVASNLMCNILSVSDNTTWKIKLTGFLSSWGLYLLGEGVQTTNKPMINYFLKISENANWSEKESTSVFLPGKSHGQRNLADYGPKVLQSVRHNWQLSREANRLQGNGKASLRRRHSNWDVHARAALHRAEREV